MRETTTLLHGFLALLISASAPAGDLTLAAPPSAEALAFARYITSIRRPDQFAESGPVAVAVEASLRGLNKESRLLAKRLTGESERSEYHAVQSDGDAAVTRAVIAPYLAAQEQVEDLPLSSVPITPANYKFFATWARSQLKARRLTRSGPWRRKERIARFETNSG